MKICLAVIAAVTLAALAVLGLNAPASAEPQPTARMVVVKSTAGQLGTGYRCVIASTGGVDCDWSTPVKVPVPR